ncbi:hypothetical protein CEXT_190271 [Caerostris extrusa]|uniref:Uncharacterized protein n=1 Tax=Caerostris extrusa TaxID=172846 RepID=A0AAV4REJ3_CAEEX|nr:hypothetical protein CEXT_190271 [Caerostris extrusa]
MQGIKYLDNHLICVECVLGENLEESLKFDEGHLPKYLLPFAVYHDKIEEYRNKKKLNKIYELVIVASDFIHHESDAAIVNGEEKKQCGSFLQRRRSRFRDWDKGAKSRAAGNSPRLQKGIKNALFT